MKKQKEFKTVTDELENIALKVCKNGKTRSEIAKYARGRGKSGEYKIVNILNEVSSLNWLRIPSSGARIGKTNRERAFNCTLDQLSAMLGDIYCPLTLKHFWIIESKNYSSLSFKMLEKNKLPTNIKKWLNEVLYDTITYLLFKEQYKNETKLPMPFLIFTILRKGTFIVYNNDYIINSFNNIKINILYDFEYISPYNDELKSLTFGNIWNIELFKNFVENNKEVLFEQDYY